MASSEIIAEVLAERCRMRVQLHRVGHRYALRFSGGIGWAPKTWNKHDDAMKRLLACASYGPVELEMLKKMCRVSLV
jgi:hypothetical protein